MPKTNVNCLGGIPPTLILYGFQRSYCSRQRVAQGYDYFLRFIKRFPDVTALADAPEDEVMKYWQGLGYYSRARNLHAAAKSMNGVFPDTYEEVRALKGVGDYTAAAICSFCAYDMPYAVVDGNVYRVLSRLFRHRYASGLYGREKIVCCFGR